MKKFAMASCAAVLALALPLATSATSLHDRRVFLAGSLRPEVVAQTLVRVEDEWMSQAAAFAECNAKVGALADCRESPQSFSKSCTTVVDAIVQGSSGDQNKAREYMQTVCSEKSLTDWHKDRCFSLKRAIDDALQFNAYANRLNFNSANLCSSFWSTFAESEKKRAEAERLAQKEMLIRANEKAKALAEKRQQEEARRQAMEAHRQALEAKENAARAKKEAAERLVRKRAEAEALAAAAQQKVKKAALEAAKAAEEHRQRQLEHERAEERLRKIKIVHEKELKANAANGTKSAAVPTQPSTNSSHKLAKAPEANLGAPKAAKLEKDKIVIAVANVTKVASKAPVPKAVVKTMSEKKA